jgi:hypothetical protein
MPRLHEFLGNRDYSLKPPATAGRSVMDPNSKNERMRAIINGLALSTEPQAKIKPPYGSQDISVSGRHLNSNENDITLPIPGAQIATPRSSTNYTRWNGSRPIVGASIPKKDSPRKDGDLVGGIDPDHDIFGTDIDNFDGTMASSDGTTSDFCDIHRRLDSGDTEKGFPTNMNHHLELAHVQQGSRLLKREHHGLFKNDTLVSSDKDLFMQSKAGKDGESNVDEPTNVERPDDLHMVGTPSLQILKSDIDLGGHSRHHPEGLQHIPNLKLKPTPVLAIAQNTASIGNPTLSSRSVIKSRLRNLPDIIHAPSVDLEVSSVHVGELRKEDFKVSIINEHSDMKKITNLAEADRKNAPTVLSGTLFSRRNDNLSEVKSSLESGESSKEVPLRLSQREPNFASGSEYLKGIVTSDHGIPRLEGMTCHPPGIGPTGSLQTGVDLELSRSLRSLYDLRGSTDAHLQRETFFSMLNTMQSERCGDLIIEKFADIVAKYNVVRHRRQYIAAELEIEIARREMCVVIRKEAVDQNLERLRQAGKVVVRGKNVNSGL